MTPTMGTRAGWLLLLATALGCGVGGWAARSRVWVDEGGAYRDLVLAIHPSFIPSNCSEFFSNLKEALSSFSKRLWASTEGHVYMGEVKVVVPGPLRRACDMAPLAMATWHRWATADIRLSPGDSFVSGLNRGDGEAWRPEDSVGDEASWTQDSLRDGAAFGPEGSVGVSVFQPEGCGRPGKYITLDPRLLLHQHLHHTLGGSLVAAWARYRWGVFEERGYHRHPRYPATYLRDDDVTPTSCANPGFASNQRLGECGESDGCPVDQDWAATVNTSLLYRTDLPQMWGFCDGSTHDREAPTPHNLLCGGSSVWEVISRHPDMARRWTHTAHHTHAHAPQEPLHDNNNSSNSEVSKTLETQNVTLSSVEQSRDSPPPVSMDGELSPDDLDGDLVFNNSTVTRENISGTPIQPQQVVLNHENVERRRKRREQNVGEAGNGSLVLPPSLVTAHIDRSSRRVKVDVEASDEGQELGVPDRTPLPLGWTPTPLDLGVPDVPARTVDGTPKPRDPGVPAGTSDGTPAAPEMVLLAASTNALVLALDLSEEAVAQVNMDALRGGILRWLWSLGKEVLVGVLAAYNNASYPLTIGPLLPAPTTASELEDQVRLLPSEEEVEDGVYGGRYCLTCVLSQATKMLEEAGVEVEAGVLLVGACSPVVTAHNLDQARRAHFTIHTFALCPATDLSFDRLAGPGGSWVLPGPAPPEERQQQRHRLLREEEDVATVLQAATHAALAAPGDARLVKVGGSVSEVEEVDVQSGGPYSTVTGNVTLPPGHHRLLMVVTTQYQAKVVEVTSPSGEELDMMRDTRQRFWTVLDPAAGPRLTYVLKFLTSSVEFPFSIRVDLYERKQDYTGLEVRLHTNNDGHFPLQPESRPLVVFAEVTLDGRPVVGSKVMLRVSHLSEDGATDMMVELLDNGNTEPDVRAEDGVYSRYLTWLPREGRYALTATATTLPMPRVTEGQVVLLTTSGVVALTVARVTSADLIPPSRVTDLAVTLVHNSTVNLTWSAPGGDLDQGSAQLYQLKMYTERSALTEEKFNSPAITVYCLSHDLDSPSQTLGTYSNPSQIPGTYSSPSQTPGTYGSLSQTPNTYGSPQHCLTRLPFTNLRWYFAIRAVDSSNNTGRISNIVSAYVPDPATTLPPTVSPSDLPSSMQTVIMSTVTPKNPHGFRTQTNATNRDYSKTATHDWRVWVAVGIGVGGVTVVLLMCICCCRRNQNNEEKDPDRPVYKIYVNNAYIQEEDGGVKVVSSGKLVEDEEPSQVQEWVNSLSKFGSSDVYGAEHGEASVANTDAPLVECRPRASIKYASPVRFGVLTNGSIMREACASSSSTSSSKPSDDPSTDDVKYRDLSETTSNSTTDGGASAASTATTDTVSPIPALDGTQTVPMNVKPVNGNLSSPLTPSQFLQQPLGIPGPTVISIHSGPAHNNGYSSDEEGGFRPRTLQGPGPRRYLPTHFSSFRYLPPPPEYRSAVGGGGPLAYPTCHTISRATATLPHGTVRSVKKRRHISFV